MELGCGVFTVSVDFELYWGVRDKRSIQQYRRHLEGVDNAIAEMLRVFRDYHIHATWATVGFLFFHDADALKSNFPALLPTYARSELSPYQYLRETPHLVTAYCFAPD